MTAAVQMSSVLLPGQDAHVVAVVQAVAGGRARLEEGGAARIALSCLVQPEPGDRVLTVQASGECWVLAVLERDGPAPLRLRADRDLEVSSAGTITIGADTLTLRARLGQMVIEELTHAGRSVAAHVGQMRLIGTALETLVDRVLLRAKRSYRVLDTDHSRSQTTDHRAETALHLHGGNTFVTAAGVVKVDASQIHMG